MGIPRLPLGELDGVPLLPEDGPYGKFTRVFVTVASAAAGAPAEAATTYEVAVRTLPLAAQQPTQLLLATAFAFYASGAPDENFRLRFRFDPAQLSYNLGTVPSAVASIQFNVRRAHRRCLLAPPPCPLLLPPPTLLLPSSRPLLN